MEGVAIRAADGKELDAVLDMYEWLLEPPGSTPASWARGRARRALAEAIEGADTTILVADAGAEGLAGFVSAYLDLNSVRFGLRCWVEDLAVDRARRSAGIGAELLQAAKAWAREHGATHLELDTAIARVDAQRFYERHGYTSIEPDRNERAFYFFRELQPPT